MTWQDELQKLDADLASGRISADDYRRRRDEVLAASSGGAPPQGQPGQGQPGQQGPFAPPFRWDATPPGQTPAADATQVVKGNQNADATQVVKTQGGGDADRTQYVRPVGPPSGPLPQQQPPVGWQSAPPQHGGGNQPPWGSQDGFGPIADPNPSWIAQGPEVFDDGGGNGGGRKVLAIVGVVLVLALIGGGVWWFTSGKSTTPPVAESTSQTATTTSAPKPKDDLEIAKLPGTGQDQSGVKNFADVMANKLLNSEENDAYTAAGATRVRLATSALPKEVRVSVMTVQTTSSASCLTALAALQTKFGMQAYSGTSPKGVTVNQVPTDGTKRGAVRAHYMNKNTVVRIQVDGTDFAQVTKTFDEIVAAQLEALPADA